MSASLAATVAANLRAIRAKRGMKLAVLAELTVAAGCPLSLNTLSKVERGVRGVTIAELEALADCLMVEPAELLGDLGPVRLSTVRVLYDALMHRGHEGTLAPCKVCDALDEARRVLAGAS